MRYILVILLLIVGCSTEPTKPRIDIREQGYETLREILANLANDGWWFPSPFEQIGDTAYYHVFNGTLITNGFDSLTINYTTVFDCDPSVGKWEYDVYPSVDKVSFKRISEDVNNGEPYEVSYYVVLMFYGYNQQDNYDGTYTFSKGYQCIAISEYDIDLNFWEHGERFNDVYYNQYYEIKIPTNGEPWEPILNPRPVARVFLSLHYCLYQRIIHLSMKFIVKRIKHLLSYLPLTDSMDLLYLLQQRSCYVQEGRKVSYYQLDNGATD